MLKNNSIYKLIVVILLFANTSIAQINRNYTYREPEKPEKKTSTKKTSKQKPEPVPFLIAGLEYGFNLGGYLANNKTANYFNGQSGSNNIENIIGKDAYAGSINGAYSPIHEEIKDALGGYEFHIKELPTRMRYNPGALLGKFNPVS